MAQQTIQGNIALAKQIKQRRIELGLTIEEAASRAEVGTKTWCRYEAGESIRKDKCKGICKALNWLSLPNGEEKNDDVLSIEDYKDHTAWSKYLEKQYGDMAAMSFAAGSDILLDHVETDLNSLSSLPVGTHIGQLSVSLLEYDLPDQFLMEYNYDFLFKMKCKIQQMRGAAKLGVPMIAHSVLEELIIYLCNEEANALIELYDGIEGIKGNTTADWVFDLFDDMDVITFLYSDIYVSEDHPYHFLHWSEDQLFVDED